MKVPLTKEGHFATVDKADWLVVRNYIWHLDVSRSGNHYARTRIFDGHGKVAIDMSMHRFLLSAEDSQFIDHIDGDGLNNRRSNLRFCTRSQNAANSGPRIDNSSGHKHIFWENSNGGRWCATLVYEGKRYRKRSKHDLDRLFKFLNSVVEGLHGEFAFKPSKHKKQKR